jgi:hypothetical protein
MGKAIRRTNEQWQRILAAYEVSGFSQEEWCEKHKININTFRGRLSRLRNPDKRVGESHDERQTNWIEVTNESPTTRVNVPGIINIEIGAFRLSADSNYPASALAALLRELARPC